MRARSGLLASAAIGVLLGPAALPLQAQSLPGVSIQAVGRMARFAPGSIKGIVRDETGLPVAGVTVSAVGSTTAVAVTDRNGRFDLQTLSPGPYLVRAHLSGYFVPRAQVLEVRSSEQTSSSIALRRTGSAPLLTAGTGGVLLEQPEPTDAPADVSSAGRGDEQSESAWRLRHLRRGILKDSTFTDLWEFDRAPSERVVFDSLLASPVRLATNFFTETPFSGQLNLLTTGSFDTPQQLFSSDNLSQGIAYIRLGAPAGSQADWAIRGALSQSDISSWILAGSYVTRIPARHKYEIGMSYSTQRYDGGNPLALRDVTDGSRNAGALYGFDTFTVTPAIAFRYGGRYARYDYLDSRGLFSPAMELTLTPADTLRINAEVARVAHAPGAEEFLPPAENGIWLPPQRTFSSIQSGQPFEAQRATHLAVTVERDVAGSTLSFSAYRQQLEDRLVTLFGADLPGRPSATLGHYFIGNAGDAEALGCRAAFRTTLAGRVSGSLAYSMTDAAFAPGDVRYLIVLAPTAVRAATERIHDVSTVIETNVPETSTRLLVLYRLSSGFAGQGALDPVRSGLDSRFDVQVRQSLPFLNFTNARWEMLVAVRNFFHEAGGTESVLDELFVVNPPKRVVGGVTMRF